MGAMRSDAYAALIVGDRRLGRIETPAPAATRSAIRRTPSTSTGTRNSTLLRARRRFDLVAQRVAIGGRIIDSRASVRNVTESVASIGNFGGNKRDEVFVAEMLDEEPRVATGSVTIALASSRVARPRPRAAPTRLR